MEVCCFDSHHDCLLEAAYVAYDCLERRDLGPDHCAVECDELEMEGEIEYFEWDDCYLDCHVGTVGETECFEEEELKCIPCEEEEEPDCEEHCNEMFDMDEIDRAEWEECLIECE